MSKLELYSNSDSTALVGQGQAGHRRLTVERIRTALTEYRDIPGAILTALCCRDG